MLTNLPALPYAPQAKQADLKEVMDRLAKLEAQLEQSMADKTRLEAEVELCTQKLERAEKLITGTWVGERVGGGRVNKEGASESRSGGQNVEGSAARIHAGVCECACA